MREDVVLVVGLDDESPPPPPPPRRIGWAALAVVAGLAVWLGGSFDLEPTPADDPAPLPVAEPPPDPTGGRTWVEVEGGGDGVVDAGGPVLLGTRSWDPDGGSWRLLVGDDVLDVGGLPRNPVATVDDNRLVLVVGRAPDEGLQVATIDPATGARRDVDVVPEPGRRPPEAIAEVDQSLFVDAGDRVWTRPAPGDPWEVHELVSAVAVTGDGVFGFAPSYERVLVYRWDGSGTFEPVGTIGMDDEHPATVTSTWGPGWAFVEACRGSDCRRFARPDGGEWGTAPDLPALPRWNGERWWSAALFALRSRPPILVSDDGSTWEELPMPRFWLGADEQARALVLPDDRLLIALLRPNGSSTLLVGERD